MAVARRGRERERERKICCKKKCELCCGCNRPRWRKGRSRVESFERADVRLLGFYSTLLYYSVSALRPESRRRTSYHQRYDCLYDSMFMLCGGGYTPRTTSHGRGTRFMYHGSEEKQCLRKTWTNSRGCFLGRLDQVVEHL